MSVGERKQVTVIYADVANFGEITSRLDDEDLLRLNQAILVFLGLATSPRARLGG